MSRPLATDLRDDSPLSQINDATSPLTRRPVGPAPAVARKSALGRGQVSHLEWTEALARARCQNPAWVIVRNEDGTYTARRAFWGNQQLITVPTLCELETRLQASSRTWRDNHRIHEQCPDSERTRDRDRHPPASGQPGSAPPRR